MKLTVEHKGNLIVAQTADELIAAASFALQYARWLADEPAMPQLGTPSFQIEKNCNEAEITADIAEAPHPTTLTVPNVAAKTSKRGPLTIRQAVKEAILRKDPEHEWSGNEIVDDVRRMIPTASDNSVKTMITAFRNIFCVETRRAYKGGIFWRTLPAQRDKRQQSGKQLVDAANIKRVAIAASETPRMRHEGEFGVVETCAPGGNPELAAMLLPPPSGVALIAKVHREGDTWMWQPTGGDTLPLLAA